jgi:hypothetical protein
MTQGWLNLTNVLPERSDTNTLAPTHMVLLRAEERMN